MKSLKTYLIEALLDTEIFEMAYNRKNFMNKAHNLARQIIENWCLAKYCTITNTHTGLKNHWKNELSSYLIDLFEDEITTDKQAALEDIWMNKDEYNKCSKISLMIKKKFKTENLQLDNDYNKVCNLFAENLHTIIKLISAKYTEANYNKLEEYIEKL